MKATTMTSISTSGRAGIRAWALRAAVLAVVGGGVATTPPAVFAQNPAPAPVQQQADNSASTALAARLEVGATGLLAVASSNPDANADLLRAGIALLEAAQKLDPAQASYPAALVDAYLKLGQLDKAQEALKAFRTIRPDDQVAMIRTVDLHVESMQTAQDRMSYLQQVADNDKLPATLRSHAALKMAGTYLDRGEDALADAAVAKAVALNSVNVPALEMKYKRQLATNASRVERVKTMVELLKANVARPEVMAQLAKELATVNLPDQALSWYTSSFALSRQLGQLPALDDIIDSAAILLATGQPQAASAQLDVILKQQPDNTAARFMQLAVEAKAGDAEKFKQSADEVRTLLHQRLAAIEAAAAAKTPEEAAKIDPAKLPKTLPDVIAVAKKLKEGGKPELAELYFRTLADLAWLDVMFVKQQANGSVLTAMTALAAAADADPTVASVAGWNLLLNNQLEDARQKFAVVADKNVLAATGLVRIDVAEKKDPKAIEESAREVIRRSPTGLFGVIVADNLRQQVGEGAFANAEAPDVKAAVADFPRKLLDLIDDSPARQKIAEFYSLKVEPCTPDGRDRKIGHGYGEPVYVRVTIVNKSDFPMSVGPGCLLRTEVSVDGTLRGVGGNQAFPAIAVAQLTQKVRLEPREVMTSVVRADTGDFRAMLSAVPGVAYPMFFSAVTNPLSTGDGRILPGPAGVRQQAESVAQREASPWAQPQVQQNLINRLRIGGGLEKVNAAEVLATSVAMIRKQDAEGKIPDAQKADAKAIANEFTEALLRARDADASPAVRAYVSYALAAVTAPAEKKAAVTRMLQSEAWESRLLGLQAVLDLPRDEQLPTLQQALRDDPDHPEIKQLQAALIEAVKKAPATAPSTQPAAPAAPGAPGAAPATSQPSSEFRL
jgi:tetratricopeptide (TPR) repeat protein